MDPPAGRVGTSGRNLANPVSNEGSSSFGKITATVGSATATAVGTTAGVVGGGPRVIQFSMGLSF